MVKNQHRTFLLIATVAGVINEAKMSDSLSAYVQRMHYGWYLQAMNSLFGAEARQLYLKMNKKERQAFIDCLDRVEDEFDVQSGAQCIVKVLDKQLIDPGPGKDVKTKADGAKDWIGGFRISDSSPPSSQKLSEKKKKYSLSQIVKHGRQYAKYKEPDKRMPEQKSGITTHKASVPAPLHRSPFRAHYPIASPILPRPDTNSKITENVRQRSFRFEHYKPQNNRTTLRRPLTRTMLLKQTERWTMRSNNAVSKHTAFASPASAKTINWARFAHYQQMRRRRMRRSPYRFNEKEDDYWPPAKPKDENNQIIPVKHLPQAPSLLSKSHDEDLSVLGNLARVFTKFVALANAPDPDVKPVPRNSIVQRVMELRKRIETHHDDHKYRKRMLDVVLGEGNAYRRPRTKSDRLRRFMPEPGHNITRQIFALLDVLSKHTTDSNTRILSPQVGSILPMPETSHILSPNILPLYHDDSSNSIASVPKILDATGMNNKDRDSVLELVMELSGTNRIIDGVFKIMNNAKAWGIEENLLDVTNFMKTTFDALENSFSRRQKRDLATKQFSFMNAKQMEQFYGPSFLNLSSYPIAEYSEIARSEVAKRQLLHACIRHYAKGGGLKQNGANLLRAADYKKTLPAQMEDKNRTKRSFYEIDFGPQITILGQTIPLFKITFLSPTVLTLVAFSPSFNQFIILGPAVISPNLFSPDIAAPFFLSPLIMAAAMGPPLIMSGYFLSPQIMSAAVWEPYALSPYFMSPNVITPYVMSPLILSPFLLCPDTVSPTIFGGTILSPYFLSPALFTESAFASDVLSPSFLSKRKRK